MDNPTVTVNGDEHELYDERDVKTVFEDDTPFAPGEQFEEWLVDSIDYELDYHNSRDAYILRAYVYFTGVTPDSGDIIDESILNLPGWRRRDNLLTDEGIGIVYEKDAT